MGTDREEISLQICEIAAALQESEPMQNYMESQRKMRKSKEAERLIEAFQAAKAAFDTVSSYGKWAPDYEEKRVRLSEAKKKLEENNEIAQFKASEKQLSLLLDQLTVRIFSDVLPKIPMDLQSPFLLSGKTNSCGCKSGCKCKG